ncbi:MAG: 16S rRNA (cytidine(1402)-2'-O)-methyltransferase [Candidatus Coatesbacteria bacterium]|nr:MAG: 16S rRNA (cytidine(1402)-2'-O)-methyltransferase [Candidatus Coatesbacteria bacterium]
MGKLVIVSTPIGNLGDLAPRVVEALAGADVIACEDTRVTAKLAARAGASAELMTYAEHNEAEAAAELVGRLATGAAVALVSDAGTPLLSDPGYRLVRATLDAGHELDAVPGPSAVHNALVLSGLPPYPYAFLGYFPKKTGERTEFVERYGGLGMTTVVFLSPHRLKDELAALAEAWRERPAALCREMTKLHQEVIRGTLNEIHLAITERDSVKGELTLVIGAGPEPDELGRAVALAVQAVDKGLSRKDAARLAADEYGVSKNEVYKLLVTC